MARTTQSPENLTKKDYELLAEFRYTLRKFLGFSEAAATSHKVSAQQYQALLAIEGFPGRNWVTIGELAEQLRTAHHSAVGLVDRMEALRLVRRAKSREDGRRVQVSLTPKGLGVLEKLYRAHRQELKTIGPKLIGLLQKASVSLPDDVSPQVFSSPACSMPEIKD
ncbi:MAG TPA: MarR family transcriptional regulator [Rariglobus sp.]|jgi:DNA-binding MarR family transcriptional regulator|nr:MarR family transcriptional regulator [Rariglobus sp.]